MTRQLASLLRVTISLSLAACGSSHELVDGAAADGAATDLGPASVDGGPPAIDAGPPAVDAGPPAIDAGTIDAFTPPDAGGEPCPAPGVSEPVSCGSCGTGTRFCTVDHVWTYGPCMGEGECAAGTVGTAPCGMCGTGPAHCNTMCMWEPAGACTGEGVCAPGTTMADTTGCPAGQVRTMTCSDACAYVAGTCMPDDCTPGDMRSMPCGTHCGTQTQMCDMTHHWVDGACMGEGPCVPGATDTVACGHCGSAASTCSASCRWTTGACTGDPTCSAPPAPTCADTMTVAISIVGATCSPATCTSTPLDLVCPGSCSAGACTGAKMISGLGGPAGFGTGVLGPSDDGSSPAIPTTPFASGLLYYGTTYTNVYINNNGNLSFGAPNGGYNPAFPSTGVPFIAPWWADVDTRGGGAPAQNEVDWSTDATHLYATWDLVGYFAMHDTSQDSFQVVLTDRSDVSPGDFDVDFRYDACVWTTGDASGGTGGLGGTPASAGFDAGDGERYLALPGSGTATILSLCTTSNIGVPGIWHYEVRGGLPR